jgi:hypothetical protein
MVFWAVESVCSVYWLAISDFHCLPSIQQLDLSNYKGRSGDTIAIRVVDVIGLAEMTVSIVAQDGTPVECGKAVEMGARSGQWTYTATQFVSLGTHIFIEVAGVDHAGNRVQFSENHTVGVDN